ncbi:unnamed protein product [Dicrocoelium dendriticum]|nr:unnamed protein product [Dicrocoelium dendriticum]
MPTCPSYFFISRYIAYRRMPSARTKERTKPADSSGMDSYLKKMFDIFALQDNKCLMTHLDNPKQLTDSLKSCLINRQLVPTRPSRSLPPVQHGSECRQVCTVENDDSTTAVAVPVSLAEEVDLWDAAVLDYFMEVVFWSVHEWVTITNSTVFKDTVATQIDEADVEAASLCVAMTMAHLMLSHLQLLHKNPLKISKDRNEDCPNGFNQSENMIASIRFIKSLFQCNRDTRYMSNPNETNKSDDEKILHDFESKYFGILSILTSKAASSLVQFFTKHFLQIYRLLRNTFGMGHGRKQEVVGVPCELILETLPQQFDCIESKWPPPLSEAIPLQLAFNYAHIFPEPVTRWLCCLPSEPEHVATEVSTPKEEALEPPQTEIQEPVSEDMTRYLTLLDQLDTEEMELVAGLNAADVEEAVSTFVTEYVHEKLDSHTKEMDNILKDQQLRLANYLIQAAGEKIYKIKLKQE